MGYILVTLGFAIIVLGAWHIKLGLQVICDAT